MENKAEQKTNDFLAFQSRTLQSGNSQILSNSRRRCKCCDVNEIVFYATADLWLMDATHEENERETDRENNELQCYEPPYGEGGVLAGWRRGP